MKGKYSFIILSLAGFLSSCSKDFLNLQPELTLASNTFYKTEADYLTTLNAVYAGYRDVLPSFYVMAETRSDNTTNHFNVGNRGTGTVPYEELDEFYMTSTNLANNYWGTGYSAIYKANSFLDLLSQAPEHVIKTAGLRERMEAEARFARAFHYFNLVRFYGDVPLVLEPIETAGDAFNVPRSPESEVFAAIVEDATYAAANLPATYESEKGRITKGAALMLLAKVQMTQHDFDGAIATLRQITGYSLEPNYANCFNPAFKNGVESIFEVQYSTDATTGNNTLVFNWVPLGDVAWNTIVNDGSGGNGTQWNIPTKDLVNNGYYDPADLRKDISVGIVNLPIPGQSASDQVAYIKKWIVYSNTSARRENPSNMVIYRYADVLLMLAEALNEQGYQAAGEAFNLLNEVRARAGLTTALTGADIPNQEAFRLAIERERRIELAFEGHRWFDLLRTDRAIPVMQAYAEIEKANPSSYRNPGWEFTSRSYNIQEYMLLYPIPYSEQIKNPSVVTQNPGY